MQLTIEKMIYGGDGLARGPVGSTGRGKAVFLPFVLPGERVQCKVTEEKPGFMRASVTKLLEPSPKRVEPGCPYFGQCGGCQYQHASYEEQLEIKSAILHETLQRTGQLDPPAIRVHASPPWHYRNRTRMRVQADGSSFGIGYFRASTHDLLPVEQCPISSPLINRAVAAIWELGRAGKVSPVLAEIEFFVNDTDDQLLLEFTMPDQYWKRANRPSLVDFVRELRAAMPEIAGVTAFRNASGGRIVREEVPEKVREVFGTDELVYNVAGCEYRVSAGSFFQTNRYLTGTLLELVTADRSGQAALDLYAGTGLFTLPLSQGYDEVIAVEAAPFSFHDLRRNTPSNVKASRETTEDFLARAGEELVSEFDLIVVDPPRSGLGEKTALGIAALRSQFLVYVSCDPATLARDLKALLAEGYHLDQLHLVDIFPQTFHIETLAKLSR